MTVVDGNGLPLGLLIYSAQPHEIRLAQATLATISVPRNVGRPKTRPERLVADKAYDSRAFRNYLRRRGIASTIPTYIRAAERRPRRGRPIQVGASYRQRWKVERCFAWMDNCRRLVVRYDRTVLMYRAFCLLAFSLWCLNAFLK